MTTPQGREFSILNLKFLMVCLHCELAEGLILIKPIVITGEEGKFGKW